MKQILLPINLSKTASIQSQWYSSKDYASILNVINNEKLKSCKTIVINDLHEKNDKEFNYLPPHMTGKITDSMIELNGDYEKRNKREFSAIANQQTKEYVLSLGIPIVLCGFMASADIMATAFDLIKYDAEFSILKDGVGDINNELKEKSLWIMKKLNVQII